MAERVSDRDGWNSHIRGGWVVLWLWTGSRLSNRDIAKLTGMTRQGAQSMMEILEVAFPIRFVDGKWEWMEKST
jgi:hypothetical protein